MAQLEGDSGGDSSGDAAGADMGGELTSSSDMGGETGPISGESTDMGGSDNTEEESSISGDDNRGSEEQPGIEPEEDSETGLEPGEFEEGEEEKESEEKDEKEEEKEDEEERKPLNYQYANSTFSFEGTDDELHGKYPEGVKFDAEGYPDFSPYAMEIVEIDMRGNHTTDYKAANEAAGLARTPEGYTWHHHQDGKTMLLVPSDLHGAVRHTGGVSTIRHGHNSQE